MSRTDSPKFHSLLKQVQTALDELHSTTDVSAALLVQERDDLLANIKGWRISLGDPNLGHAVRSDIQSDYERATERLTKIDQQLGASEHGKTAQNQVLDPAEADYHLEHLATTLTAGNASRTNVLLSQHIDGIYCDKNGKVAIRTCKLGCLAGALDILAEVSPPQTTSASDDPKRRLARRAVPLESLDDNVEDKLNAALEFAADPRRFGGLGSEWFHEDHLQVPARQPWHVDNAGAVAAYRLSNGTTIKETAEHFGKSEPTIHKALKHAESELGIAARGKSVGKRREPWHVQNADRVAEYFARPGATMKEAMEVFGKSDTTIRKARTAANQSN